MDTEKFLNKIETFLDDNKGLSSLLDKNYKLYLNELKLLSQTNKRLIQLHWFITQIVTENNLESITMLTLNTFYEITKPDACSIYLLKNDKKIVESDSINKSMCKYSNDCNFIKNITNNSDKALELNKISKKNTSCINSQNLCCYSSCISYTLYKKDGNILGYLVAFYKETKPILSSDVKLLMDIFKIQIGLSLGSFLLEKKMTELAFRDELTGLFNKRMLLKQIKSEVEKYNASPDNSSGIGCIMIDIDNFKHYNDSFGHVAGDFVIQHLGEVILNNISKSDIGARYGGEEMCIILPNRTLDESIEIAELIRKQIDETIFEFRKVTISLGVSHYPTNIDCKFPEVASKIIECADNCLYHSKNTGKNKVTSQCNIV